MDIIARSIIVFWCVVGACLLAVVLYHAPAVIPVSAGLGLAVFSLLWALDRVAK